MRGHGCLQEHCAPDPWGQCCVGTQSEPYCYWWFTQSGWLDASTRHEDLDFLEKDFDFDYMDFCDWVEHHYPDTTNSIHGVGDHRDATWYTFDPEIGFKGFQRIIEEYARQEARSMGFTLSIDEEE